MERDRTTYRQQMTQWRTQLEAKDREKAGLHETIENIQAARRLGAAGFVLFSYDSLSGEKTPDYLATVRRGAFVVNSTTPQSPTPK